MDILLKKISGYQQKTSECISMDSSDSLDFLNNQEEKYT